MMSSPLIKAPSTAEYREAVRYCRDKWVPACGGLEVPMIDRNRRRVLYVYNPRHRQHRYIDLGTDIILPADYDPAAIDGGLS